LYLRPELDGCKTELLAIAEKSFTSANWQYYQDGIIEAWTVARLVAVGNVLRDGNGKSQELINHVEKALLEIGGIAGKNTIIPIEDSFMPWMKTLESRIELKGAIPGISWGMSKMDSATLGAQNGQLVVICGRPSEGKSAIAVQLMRHQGFRVGVPVGMVSIESSTSEVVGRFISGAVPIDGIRTKLGLVSVPQLQDIRTFLEDAEGKKNRVFVYDRPGATLSEVRSACRRMVLNHGVRVIYVDYLQLITVPGSENKIDEVGKAVVALKNIARELDICVVALAQLKRAEKNERPTMASIQWASAVEQTADGIWLIWHKKDGDKITDSRIIIEKARDGMTMDVKVFFNKPHVTFAEIEEERK
jgi:replicative DNA helicase